MALDYEESKQKIIEGLQKKSKSKSKFYFSDLAKILDAKPREAKKIVTQMINEGILEFWSSGSTSMYGLKGAGKQSAAEHENE
ncbi:MAG: dissimilatory sulfite reductase D family protein [Desulfobacteraceae bacterium]|nr:dissimilatory sulfite reductase D family protein [Desulfobacteraceae bacterium]